MHSPLTVTYWVRSLIRELSARLFPAEPHKRAEGAIDEAFAKMGEDADYQRDSIRLVCEFETSDLEASKSAN